jgi:hypothetical protein
MRHEGSALPSSRTMRETNKGDRQMTVAEIRAQVEAAKIVAMSNFERTWGTRDVQTVVNALRQTAPNSASLADAARKAQAITRKR